MTQVSAFHAAQIFDGSTWHEDAALIVADGRIVGITPTSKAPDGHQIAGAIVPGLIDAQVNGGGGVLFNNDLSASAIKAICAAHAQFGTTSVMVTLITDTVANGRAALEAGQAALETPGLLGMHMEGPHLDRARKGTHDSDLILPMDPSDLAALTNAAAAFERLICTVAPESVTPGQVAELARAGVIVSLGHTSCTYETATDYADAGATMVTHLFNGMEQMQHRAPGLVGAALDDGRLSAGLIADGFHIADAPMRIALRGKAGPAGLFLVSDAMSTIGSDQTEFTLNGRTIYRADGRLTLADGTLAGADIALIDGVRYVHRNLGLPLGEALTLATLAPARALGLSDRGHLQPDARADFFALSPDITATGTWIGGAKVGDVP